MSTDNCNTLYFIFRIIGYKNVSTNSAKASIIAAALEEAIQLQLHLKESSIQEEQVISYTNTCNDYMTHDGIDAGGNRLASELIDVIEQKTRSYCSSGNKNVTDISISFLGVSLGGLYSRYALAKLHELFTADKTANNNNNMTMTIAGNGEHEKSIELNVHFNSYYSYASPHLGLVNNTFIPLKRFVEKALAEITGKTGQDVFFKNDLLYRMATEPYFLDALSLFQKRVAFGNAFNTDLMVTTGTSVFLHQKNEYPQYILKDDEQNSEERCEDNLAISSPYQNSLAAKKMICGSFVTKREDSHKFSHIIKQTESEIKKKTAQAESSTDDAIENEKKSLQMSLCLDSLGWTKILVDVRSEIPSISLIKSSSQDSDDSITNQDFEQSKTLLSKFSAAKDGLRIALPLGHRIVMGSPTPFLKKEKQTAAYPLIGLMVNSFVKDTFSFQTSAFIGN